MKNPSVSGIEKSPFFHEYFGSTSRFTGFNWVILFYMVFLIAGCNSSNIKKGFICLNLGDYPMAIEFFDKELRAHPDNYEARIGLGKAFLQKAVDINNDSASWKMSLIHLEAARSLRPDNASVSLLSQVWTEYSHRLLLAGDTVPALEALSSALQYDPENIALLNRIGILYFKLGYAEKSIILFKNALSFDSTHAHSFFNLGMVHWANNDYGKAREFWLKALALDSEDKDILYWFARVKKKLKEQE
ncbi:MAG: tetratricopeptide repeat protein [Chitinivibrionales bacterium]|nr:tetratricopeptide repeat protein [Chitinivibrionales bacterium]